ncbi:BMP family ABC transporter substrate-binding protein [Borrelia persica]|uniref:BMP family ABC transporter substrate-binding protein n=1 Tax=Borrelia persica TaxID=44448 RepID=UPI0004650ACD|nr:BMP family ABC transporter substrate-binding protein [Borrelia persica]
MCRGLCFIFLFFLLFMSCFNSKSNFLNSSNNINERVVMGMVALGNFDDNGYLQTSFEGAVRVKDEFGINFISKVTTPSYSVEGERIMTADEVLSKDVYSLQKEGANFVWFISAHFSEPVIRFVHENPNIFYGIIDPFHYDDVLISKNFLAINFRSEEGAFLAGYLASKKSKSNRIGFVTGVRVDYVERFWVGFKAGAFYANPKTRVILKRMLDDVNEVSGKLFAEYMYTEDDIDVIFPVMGPASLGMFIAAKELGDGHYIIGVNKDQSHLAPGHVITSVIKDVGKAIYENSIDIIKGHKFHGGKVISVGIKENFIDIVKDPSVLDSDLIDALTKLQNKIINKEIIVPVTEHEFDLFKLR